MWQTTILNFNSKTPFLELFTIQTFYRWLFVIVVVIHKSPTESHRPIIKSCHVKGCTPTAATKSKSKKKKQNTKHTFIHTTLNKGIKYSKIHKIDRHGGAARDIDSSNKMSKQIHMQQKQRHNRGTKPIRYKWFNILLHEYKYKCLYMYNVQCTAFGQRFKLPFDECLYVWSLVILLAVTQINKVK